MIQQLRSAVQVAPGDASAPPAPPLEEKAQTAACAASTGTTLTPLAMNAQPCDITHKPEASPISVEHERGKNDELEALVLSLKDEMAELRSQLQSSQEALTALQKKPQTEIVPPPPAEDGTLGQAQTNMRVDFAIENIDFDKLSSGQKDQIEKSAKSQISKSAGVPEDHIHVALSKGSLKFTATIISHQPAYPEFTTDPSRVIEVASALVEEVSNLPSVEDIMEDPSKPLVAVGCTLAVISSSSVPPPPPTSAPADESQPAANASAPAEVPPPSPPPQPAPPASAPVDMAPPAPPSEPPPLPSIRSPMGTSNLKGVEQQTGLGELDASKEAPSTQKVDDEIWGPKAKRGLPSPEVWGNVGLGRALGGRDEDSTLDQAEKRRRAVEAAERRQQEIVQQPELARMTTEEFKEARAIAQSSEEANTKTGQVETEQVTTQPDTAMNPLIETERPADAIMEPDIKKNVVDISLRTTSPPDIEEKALDLTTTQPDQTTELREDNIPRGESNEANALEEPVKAGSLEETRSLVETTGSLEETGSLDATAADRKLEAPPAATFPIGTSFVVSAHASPDVPTVSFTNFRLGSVCPDATLSKCLSMAPLVSSIMS
jgi:hypothetical protein